MTHGSLFSGIGGFDLAAQWAGWTNSFNCEINPFCKTVLAYHFPDAKQYSDIRTTDFTVWRGLIDVLSGGFPCQPFSLAGKRKGTKDDRHLWPEMLRAIREISPRWVVGENVFGIVNWSDGLVFEKVCAELETEGYEVQPYILPACAVNAPHRRDRVWFVAHSADARAEGLRERQEPADKCRTAAYAESLGSSIPGQARNGRRGFENRRTIPDWENFPTQPPVRCGNDGLSTPTHARTISNESTMDRTELILRCLKEGRIETDPETGKIYSRMVRGHEGEKIELHGSMCNGYLVHSIKYKGIKKQVRAHKIIWISINGTYDENLLMIDHINRNRKDNRIGNLRLVTAKGNRANSTPYEGRLSQEDKDRMYFLHTDGNMSFRELSKDFGISKSRVQQIVSEHSGMDGITFPAWRRESIKAYGNAIVPALAYRIFDTINDYERLNSKTHDRENHASN